MFRTFLAIALTTAALAVSSTTSAAKVCTEPVQEALSPCICDEDYLFIECGPDSGGDLTPVFERASALIDDNFVFDTVDIRGLSLSTLPANYFGNLKFRRIIFVGWPALTWVHPDAFNSTYEVTTVLMFYDTHFASTEENHHLWTAIGKFRNLQTLKLGNNQVHYIPDDAFPEPMIKLSNVELNFNELHYFGARFFVNLPALEDAYFINCGLTPDKLSLATFEGIGPKVKLFLDWNEFYQLPESFFGEVLRNVKVLSVGGTKCNSTGCYLPRFDCDEGIHWICKDVDFYTPKLNGYYCTDPFTSGNDIWDYCDSHKIKQFTKKIENETRLLELKNKHGYPYL